MVEKDVVGGGGGGETTWCVPPTSVGDAWCTVRAARCLDVVYGGKNLLVNNNMYFYSSYICGCHTVMTFVGTMVLRTSHWSCVCARLCAVVCMCMCACAYVCQYVPLLLAAM